jgi:Na+-driven multidrug efflux pump
LLVFPESVISLFFKQELSPLLQGTLDHSCLWIWLGFFAEGLNLIGFGLLSAYGDTVFQMYFSVSSWLIGFIPCYLAIHLGNAPPEALWLILAFTRFAAAGVYFARLRQEKWKALYTMKTKEKTLIDVST